MTAPDIAAAIAQLNDKAVTKDRSVVARLPFSNDWFVTWLVTTTRAMRTRLRRPNVTGVSKRGATWTPSARSGCEDATLYRQDTNLVPVSRAV